MLHYHCHASLILSPRAGAKSWDLISTAWKAATTILVLRYLYFGRPDLTPQFQQQRPPTPSFATSSLLAPREDLDAYYRGTGDFNFSDFVDESSDSENIQDYLTAGLHLTDPLSRSPSPLPSPLLYTEPPSTNLWGRRYDIHDEAFATLTTAFTALHDILDPKSLRHILVPILIFALVSRPESAERALASSYMAKFRDFMARPPTPPSPIGGAKLELDIPWEKLDAYSELIVRERRDSVVSTDLPMAKSAPEWNWGDMLKQLDLDMACKCTSAQSGSRR